MKEITYVCLYKSYRQTLAPLNDAQRGRLMFAMLDYATTGQQPCLKGCEKLIWPTLKSQIDRDIEDYARRCATNKKNGAAGGRPRKKALGEETQGLSSKPKKANDKEKEKEKEKENNNDIVNDSESANTVHSGGVFIAPMTPPTPKQVQAYCVLMGYDFEPDRFVDYYEALGWTLGNSPVRNWKALADTWGKNQRTPVDPDDPETLILRRMFANQV